MQTIGKGGLSIKFGESSCHAQDRCGNLLFGTRACEESNASEEHCGERTENDSEVTQTSHRNARTRQRTDRFTKRGLMSASIRETSASIAFNKKLTAFASERAKTLSATSRLRSGSNFNMAYSNQMQQWGVSSQQRSGMLHSHRLVMYSRQNADADRSHWPCKKEPAKTASQCVLLRQEQPKLSSIWFSVAEPCCHCVLSSSTRDLPEEFVFVRPLSNSWQAMYRSAYVHGLNVPTDSGWPKIYTVSLALSVFGVVRFSCGVTSRRLSGICV